MLKVITITFDFTQQCHGLSLKLFRHVHGHDVKILYSCWIYIQLDRALINNFVLSARDDSGRTVCYCNYKSVFDIHFIVAEIKVTCFPVKESKSICKNFVDHIEEITLFQEVFNRLGKPCSPFCKLCKDISDAILWCCDTFVLYVMMTQ